MTRFAMDDAYPTERDEALKLVESCAECAGLATDVRLIATAMPRLPVASRTRDFTITADQAERLRGSGFSRWLRTLAMPGWAALRPVAGVALSIGLVMAVVGAGMPGMTPAAELRTGTPNQSAAPPVRAVEESMSPRVDPPANPAAGEGSPDDGSLGAETARETQDPASQHLDTAYVAASPDANTEGRLELAQSVPADPARDWLVYGGLLIAMLSFGLLALAWIARRYFADPLLR